MKFGKDDSAPPVDATGNMTLFEHLAELRNRLMKIVLAVIIGTIIGYVFYIRIKNAMEKPYIDLCDSGQISCLEANGKPGTINLDPLGGFAVRLRVSGYIGILLAFPVILWQLWRFIAPGLLDKEKKYAAPFMIASILLFVAGAYTAWWTFPKALEWLVDTGGTTAAFDVSKYLGFIALLMIGYGIGFEFPVILVTLQLIGIVTPQQLAKSRRGALVGVVIIAAVVTPGGDPFSMLGLALPLIAFYEISLIIGRLAARRKRRTAVT